MTLHFLSDSDVEVLKALIAQYRQTIKNVPVKNTQQVVHRASDIVRVYVPTYIEQHTGSSPGTVNATVWDVYEDISAGYTIPITKSRYYPTVPGFHYAGIDRHGVWRILLAENEMLIQTPVAGIPGKSSTTPPFGFGSALCQIIDPSTEDFVSPASYIIVKNIVDQDIAGTAVGKAAMVGGVWIIDVASCSPSEA